MPNVLICHRREDLAEAQRLEDIVRHDFVGATTVRISDDRALPEGAELDRLVADADLCLVLVTPGWLNRSDALLRARLVSPDDPISVVLQLAARRDLAFIVVVTEGAARPSGEELPVGIRFLSSMNVVGLDDRRHLVFFARNLFADDGYAARFRPSWKREPQVLLYPFRGDSDPSEAPAASDGFASMDDFDPDRSLGVRGDATSLADPFSPPSSFELPASARPPRAPAPSASPPPPPPPPIVKPREHQDSTETSAPPLAEPVWLAASAPQRVTAGDEFTARFVAYALAHEAAVREELGRLSPRATSHMGLKTCQWQRGTSVTVRLSAGGLNVSPETQRFVWEEDARQLIEFDVMVPGTARESTVVLKFDVSIEGIVVAILRLDLEVTARSDKPEAPDDAVAFVSAARTAFASYSSADRDRVLDRVAAVRISAGLDVFLDCLSLHPGEVWKAQLETEIIERDLFLLFWSTDASTSPWVTWEWRTALERKGLHAMQIHPLQSGVKPPRELEHLHFGDVYMLVRETSPESL